MKLKMTYLFALLLFPFLFTLQGVHGRAESCLKPVLAHLNQSGQVYDCVDFYKQPAFDHHTLKNLVPKVRLKSMTSIQERFNIAEGGCPDGSVPILRTTPSIFDDPPRLRPPPEAQPHCHASIQTNTDSKFYGSHAKLSINKPKVQGDQWSTGRIKLSNGPDSIEAGWMVFPSFFKDDQAHLYAKYNAGPTECLNLNCPGFVQVSQNIPLGSVPDAYSVIEGEQRVWDLSIDKHSDDGDWWLSITLDTGTEQIGYWPSSLFTGLKDAAAQVQWGGEIDDPGAAEPAPAMGSGWKAIYNRCYSAFLQEVTVVVNESRDKGEPQGTEKSADCKYLYTVLDWGDRGTPAGRIMFYGGSQRGFLGP